MKKEEIEQVSTDDQIKLAIELYYEIDKNLWGRFPDRKGILARLDTIQHWNSLELSKKLITSLCTANECIRKERQALLLSFINFCTNCNKAIIRKKDFVEYLKSAKATEEEMAKVKIKWVFDFAEKYKALTKGKNPSYFQLNIDRLNKIKDGLYETSSS